MLNESLITCHESIVLDCPVEVDFACTEGVACCEVHRNSVLWDTIRQSSAIYKNIEVMPLSPIPPVSAL